MSKSGLLLFNTLLKQSSKSYANTGFCSAQSPRTFGALTSCKTSFARSYKGYCCNCSNGTATTFRVSMMYGITAVARARLIASSTIS